MDLILYSKAGCCLCASLEEKLQQIKSDPQGFEITLEVRDINTDPQWQAQFAYSIPVLCRRIGDQEQILPPISPRTSTQALRILLQRFAQGSIF